MNQEGARHQRATMLVHGPCLPPCVHTVVRARDLSGDSIIIRALISFTTKRMDKDIVRRCTRYLDITVQLPVIG